MSKTVSIAEARHDLAALVHELDRKQVITLTRRGKPAAVLLSIHEYNRLSAPRTRFWDAYTAFRESANLPALQIGQKIWRGVRDRSAGREIEL